NYLRTYSPYHALEAGTAYPATMVTTADHDDRVVPAHSFKFAARLQEYHTGSNPVLIRIETKAGHGAGKPTAMVIAEQADKWAYLFQNTGTAHAEQQCHSSTKGTNGNQTGRQRKKRALQCMGK